MACSHYQQIAIASSAACAVLNDLRLLHRIINVSCVFVFPVIFQTRVSCFCRSTTLAVQKRPRNVSSNVSWKAWANDLFLLFSVKTSRFIVVELLEPLKTSGFPTKPEAWNWYLELAMQPKILSLKYRLTILHVLYKYQMQTLGSVLSQPQTFTRLFPSFSAACIRGQISCRWCHLGAPRPGEIEVN